MLNIRDFLHCIYHVDTIYHYLFNQFIIVIKPSCPLFTHFGDFYRYGSSHQVLRARPPLRQGLDSSGQALHQARSTWIPEDRHCHGHWLLYNGFHWLLREAHPHPDQQHHCRLISSIFRMYERFFGGRLCEVLPAWWIAANQQLIYIFRNTIHR